MRRNYKRVEKIMIRSMFLVSFGLAVALTGCNDASVGTKTETTESVQISLEELYSQIEAEVELPAMVKLTDNYITNYYGIDIALLEDYLFYNAEDVIYADTIIMMELKDGADESVLKEAMETMMEHKKLELENYLPEQYTIVKNSTIKTVGDYMYLVISEKEDAIDAIITQAIH